MKLHKYPQNSRKHPDNWEIEQEILKFVKISFKLGKPYFQKIKKLQVYHGSIQICINIYKNYKKILKITRMVEGCSGHHKIGIKPSSQEINPSLKENVNKP